MAKGRVAAVTAAVNGIGKALVSKLHALGHTVVALDRDEAGLASIAGDRIRPYAVDVTNSAAVRNIFERVTNEVGPVEILVNGVGASLHEHTLEAVTDDDWDRTFDLNVKSAFFCTRAVVASMKARRWGRIITVSAVAGRTSTHFGGADFTAAKAALIGFTRQAAFELAAHGVTVNCVAPGLTLSERVAASWQARPEADRDAILRYIPIRRPSTTDEQAAAIAFLCSEEASYVCGAVLDVNGAMYVA
jgi:3-oxoacyl-[acyl-carrier protein] reductase